MHEMFPPSQILGSWVRISLEVWKSVRASSVFVFSCADSGFVERLIPRSRSPTSSIHGSRPESLIHQSRRRRRRRRRGKRRRKVIACPATSF
jgi:hypothetical protein